MHVLTTHQVAKLLGVTLPTVINWIEAGKIKAYKTPGGHRRVQWAALQAFCEAYSMPAPSLTVEKPPPKSSAPAEFTVVISSYEGDFAELLKDFLEVRHSHPVTIADTAFTTGVQCNKSAGGILILHADHSNVEAHDALMHLGEAWGVVALVSHEDQVRQKDAVAEGRLRVLIQPVSLEDIGAVVAGYAAKEWL